jgi:zinc transporter ZupT
MTVGEVLAGSIVGSVEQLAEFLQGFTSAEILFALMMMAAAQKDDDNDESSGSAALGFLAGLAMAGFLGQNLGSELITPPSESTGGAGVGGNIDFSA